MSLTHRARLSRRSGTPVVAGTDWVLVISALTLSLVGAALVWSATRVELADAGLDPERTLNRHLINLTVGVAIGFFVSRFDHRMLRAYTPILYVLALIGLLVVLTPAGVEYNGAQNWIPLVAGFTIQPSELAKPALIVASAFLLAEKRDAEAEPRDPDVALVLVLTGVPMLLILLQPDLGTMLIIGVTILAVLAVSGARRIWVVGLLGGATAAVTAALTVPGLLQPYQIARLSCFADPSQSARDFCYNAIQARIAIGAGGVDGQGLFSGPQTQGGFVPFNQTDFIFSVAGEELGLVGSLAILALLMLIIWRGLVIASRATDLFGRLIAVGVVAWFAFQSFENIGMNLGIMPITGVPLPFVSYGGTSMFASWIAIGLLINVAQDRQASRRR